MRAKLRRLSRERSIDPVQDLLFKPRTVFGIRHEEYDRRDADHESYVVETLAGSRSAADLDARTRRFLRERIPRSTLAARLEDGDCTLFVAREDDGERPVGYYWSVVAASGAVWHDSFRVPPGDALVFDAYVAEDHRRNGIYRLLQAATHDHLLGAGECDRVLTIVENRNTASMRANERFGLRPVARNYLLKLLGVNVVSLVRNGTTEVLFPLTEDRL